MTGDITRVGLPTAIKAFLAGIWIALSLSAAPAHGLGEACPDYHREDKVLGARVKEDLKRYARSQGVPERLMYLYDQLADCPACLGGDALHPILPDMYIVYSGDPPVRVPGFGSIKHRGTGWSADEEWGARQGMRDGSVKAYYILLETSECECCTATTEEEWEAWNAEGDPDPTESPDYDEELDIDTNLSYSEKDPDNLGPDPKDLTEIDNKNRYPDVIPAPPLKIPPPIRPMTTGCDACQPLVNEHNDLVIRINAQQDAVAVAHQNVKHTEKKLRLSLREIRAHALKAQDPNWEAKRDRLDARHGSLIAASLKYQAKLETQSRILTDLLSQRERLRDNVLDCESRCKLLDAQPDPEVLPEEPIDQADRSLPPYVRIASQTCPRCQTALEHRNQIARDMNELVTGLIDTGLNANSIDAWNALRTQLAEAENALKDCLETCDDDGSTGETLMSGTQSFGGTDSSVAETSEPVSDPDGILDMREEHRTCPPCKHVRNHLIRAERARDFSARQRGRAHTALEEAKRQLEEAGPRPPKSLGDQLKAAQAEFDRRDKDYQRQVENVFQAMVDFAYCLRTRCPDSVDFAPMIDGPFEEWQTFWTWLRSQGFLFVSTTCKDERCRAKASEINVWLLTAYRTWLNHEFVESLDARGRPDKSDALAARYRVLEFFADLKAQISDLRACEAQYCPDLKQDTVPDAYQQTNVAPQQCLDAPETKEVATQAGGDMLPNVCADSWLARWIFGCGERCQTTTDAAGEKESMSFYAQMMRGPSEAQIAESWAAFRASVAERDPEAEVWDWVINGESDSKGVWEPGRSRELLVPPSGEPSDPYFQSNSSVVDGLTDQWGAALVDTPAAIDNHPDAFVTGQSTIVAVIDTGIDAGHPDLDGALWTNIAELPDNSIDEDGNGFVDDVAGWNFVQDNGNVSDRNGHGTLVAGIVAARWNNGVGIAGVNPWAKVMPLKVMNFRGDGNSVDIAAAITYAVNEGARVVNVSLGGDEFSQAERLAVDYARKKDVLVVVAAGNTGIDASDYWPAGLDNVITVAATEPGDNRARYSNWGSPIDIAAPGSNILSLRARHTDLMWFVEDDYPMGRNIVGDDKLLYHATGTSFAAPFVSGVASLLFSLKPELSAAEVRRMILHSARDIETPGIDVQTGYGRLDAAAALAADPAFFVDAAIEGVGPVRTDAGLVVQVRGTADADGFSSAVIQFGEGENPGEWETLDTRVTAPVRNDVLGEIPAAALRSAPMWTLRVVTTHSNGATRENRYELKLQ